MKVFTDGEIKEQIRKDLETLGDSIDSLDDIMPFGQNGHWGSDDLDEFRCNHCGQCHELCFCKDGE